MFKPAEQQTVPDEQAAGQQGVQPALLPKEYQPILPAQRARVDAGQTDGRRESGATGQVAAAAGADPAEAWIKEWRRLIPPRGVWWRKSALGYRPDSCGNTL